MPRYFESTVLAPVDNVDSHWSINLIESLDLIPIIQDVSSHSGTRRGREALLSIVDHRTGRFDSKWTTQERHNDFISSKRRRAEGLYLGNRRQKRRAQIFLATSVEGARHAYEYTEQGMLALSQTVSNLTYPPLYGMESSPFDTQSIPYTDYDDWLEFSSPLEWTCEHILQAEQVVNMLVDVHRWSQSDDVKFWLPLLRKVVEDFKVDVLQRMLGDIKDAVKLQRVRSITDINGKSTYSFQLNEVKYPVLNALRKQHTSLSQRQTKDQSIEGKLKTLVEDIESVEREILLGLVQTVSCELDHIDQCLESVAILDIIFAKAAYGVRLNGSIPQVKSEGMIHVNRFAHPLIDSPVPIDLRLASEAPNKALMISGSNGGGKTLAMKSFGVVSAFVKMGLPIPSKRISMDDSRPVIRVDFFHDIHIVLGDKQNVGSGQSTFTAQLNSCSKIIERLSATKELANSEASEVKSQLVLLDELGGGTDANAGGAIAQAILERLLEVETCRVVATTHSSRLKALSFDNTNKNVQCAAVLLRNKNGPSDISMPSFELTYGLIGESYALDAAARCTPPLPDSVLDRASSLFEKDDQYGGNSAFNQALQRSLQLQLNMIEETRCEIDKHSAAMAECRRVMLKLASSYDGHFCRLESKLENTFQKLQELHDDPMEVIGGTLAELRLVRKTVQSQIDLLRERGLRPVRNDYRLKVGESVIIVTEGELDGTTARVVDLESLAFDDVAVVPTFGFGLDDRFAKPIVLKRSQIAMWDYESVLEDAESQPSVNSITNEKRSLNRALASLQLKQTKSTASPSNRSTGRFKSSRERKASKKRK